jgi:hypothetical protein
MRSRANAEGEEWNLSSGGCFLGSKEGAMPCHVQCSDIDKRPLAVITIFSPAVWL